MHKNHIPGGFWMLIEDRAFYIDFAVHPLFKSASASQIHNMIQQSASLIHWPDLDLTIDITSLRESALSESPMNVGSLDSMAVAS